MTGQPEPEGEIGHALKGEDLARIHGTNERVGVENYGEIMRFYAQLMRNGAGPA